MTDTPICATANSSLQVPRLLSLEGAVTQEVSRPLHKRGLFLWGPGLEQESRSLWSSTGGVRAPASSSPSSTLGVYSTCAPADP